MEDLSRVVVRLESAITDLEQRLLLVTGERDALQKKVVEQSAAEHRDE